MGLVESLCFQLYIYNYIYMYFFSCEPRKVGATYIYKLVLLQAQRTCLRSWCRSIRICCDESTTLEELLLKRWYHVRKLFIQLQKEEIHTETIRNQTILYKKWAEPNAGFELAPWFWAVLRRYKMRPQMEFCRGCESEKSPGSPIGQVYPSGVRYATGF